MYQGALAPLAASAALLGGYLVVKYLPNFSLQGFFNAYFWLIGTIAVAGGVSYPLRQVVRQPAFAHPATSAKAGICARQHVAMLLRRQRQLYTTSVLQLSSRHGYLT